MKRKERNQAKTPPAKVNLGCWYTLGEAVCNHVSSRNEVRIEHSMFYFVSKPVKSKIQVFHVTMMFRVLGHSDCTLVVHFEGGRLFNTISKFRGNVPHPCNLLSSLNSSHVLCLCGRESNNCLQLAVPSNSSSSHLVTSVEHPVSTQSLWEASVKVRMLESRQDFWALTVPLDTSGD